MRDEPTVACPDCDGRGWVRLPTADHWASGAIDDCVLCDGSGQQLMWEDENPAHAVGEL